MKKRMSVFISAVILLVSLASPAWLSAQQIRYKVIDLGTPGGPQAYLNIPDNSYARILNNRGTLAGWADTSTTDSFPSFCFSPDCFASLGFEARKEIRADLVGLADGFSSATAWISPNGLIAGWSQNGLTDPTFSGFPENRAVLWKNGEIVNLGTLPAGGYESFASAVNDRGQVAGWALNTVPDANSMACPGFCPTETRAFSWQNGNMQDLGTLGGTDAMALLVNEQGQVVGDSYTNSNPSDYCGSNIGFPLTTGVFLWENGNMKDLGNLGGTCTFAFALNNRGQVVGASTTANDQAQHPFLWNGHSMRDLGTFQGNFGNAIAISDTGKIVGWATYPGDTVFHAALWSEAGMTDLGTLPGDVNSFVADINARDQVIGTSVDSTGSFRAFLWEKGHMLDLEPLLASSGLQLGFGVANINGRGEIAGNALDANNNLHAVLLVPCDEGDSTCQDLAFGTTAVGIRPAPTVQHPAQWNGGYQFRRMLQHRLGMPRVMGTPHNNTSVSGRNATLSPTRMIFECRSVINAGCQCITERTATLSNLGNVTLDIKGIRITGAFSESSNCGTTLPPGKSCSIGVRWLLKDSSGDVYVSDNAPGSPQEVSLSGYKLCTPY